MTGTRATDLTLNGVFRRSAKVFRENFGALAPGLILPISGVIGALSVASALMDAQRRTSMTAFFALFGLQLAAGLFRMVAYSAGAFAAVQLAAGRSVTVADAWAAGRRFRMWGTLWLQAIGIFIGLILCLAPGIYASLAWALAITVVVEEGIAHSKALSRSSELMGFNPQGGWSHSPRFLMFLVYVATIATAYALAGLASLPMMVAAGVEVARGTVMEQGGLPPVLLWLQVPTSLLTSFFEASIAFLTSIASSHIYFDIRALQDGGDMEAAIAALGPSPASPSEPR